MTRLGRGWWRKRGSVREYEAAGVAAIHLEDQVMPKKCGHMEGKQVIPAAEMAAKIAAAVAARRSSEFLIIARTDARAPEGLESAIERARLYRRPGADVLFIEAPESVGEIEVVARSFDNVPLLFNYAEGGKTPPDANTALHDLCHPRPGGQGSRRARRTAGVLKRVEECP
jgi:2-methylisocitrate lyase-like PEP mutase family enzyme